MRRVSSKEGENAFADAKVACNELRVLVLDAHGLEGEVQQRGLAVLRVVLNVVHGREVCRCHQVLESVHINIMGSQ